MLYHSLIYFFETHMPCGGVLQKKEAVCLGKPSWKLQMTNNIVCHPQFKKLFDETWSSAAVTFFLQTQTKYKDKWPFHVSYCLIQCDGSKSWHLHNTFQKTCDASHHEQSIASVKKSPKHKIKIINEIVCIHHLKKTSSRPQQSDTSSVRSYSRMMT